MKITAVYISVFELPTQTPYFDLATEQLDGRDVWRMRGVGDARRDELHVLHVETDAGITGMCTVGDARYRTMRQVDLEHLRHLTLGEDATDIARLDSKLRAATRHMFTMPSWHGAFDNCLWDIAGKARGEPVYRLIGAVRPRAAAYYNYRGGGTLQAALGDIDVALGHGFRAVKDHLARDVATNLQWFEAVRMHCGDGVDVMHDAAGARYTLADAVRVGECLQDLGYRWLEEALPDRDLDGLQRLCDALEMPVLALETLMHEPELCRAWLALGACDMIRANARNGTTSVLETARYAAERGAGVELNGPGGLFGLVHAHLACVKENTTYYEYFPGGTRDELGREIGLQNPPLPVGGYVTPPEAPGWGAEWDMAHFRKQRIGVM